MKTLGFVHDVVEVVISEITIQLLADRNANISTDNLCVMPWAPQEIVPFTHFSCWCGAIHSPFGDLSDQRIVGVGHSLHHGVVRQVLADLRVLEDLALFLVLLGPHRVEEEDHERFRDCGAFTKELHVGQPPVLLWRLPYDLSQPISSSGVIPC